ncbi:hypothetical protein AN214_04128 [Pseudoalteromonas sp. P1-9]|uniref:DUF484 family protein n=1 Tax=Pseudoalteromonas sp. P1-9 TaxID=1710354 RepID=UPI0006D602DC|nr:DUF484 family protein [Pseudoalteromonas sp. P1-9]KPV93832.1 hypothetical protein AN214_04128 [Pseudoalteromonas sp. P1-9]
MNELDERQVVDYLEQNRDFLQKHPELLARLSIYDEPNGTTSLVKRQQSLLQNKNRELTDKLSHLIDNATNNEHIFKVFNQCHRLLLKTDTLEALQEKLTQTLCKGFNLLDCQLIPVNPDTHQTLLDQRFSVQTSFLGRLSQDEQMLLFKKTVGSVAVYLVGDKNTPTAILAFASSDETHYHPEQNSVFVLEFIQALNIKLSQL